MVRNGQCLKKEVIKTVPHSVRWTKRAAAGAVCIHNSFGALIFPKGKTLKNGKSGRNCSTTASKGESLEIWYDVDTMMQLHCRSDALLCTSSKGKREQHEYDSKGKVEPHR